MGIYYHYVNLSKRERFAIDALGGSNKRCGLGRTLASRAMHLMLENPNGRWSGDKITIMGDDITPEWESICQEFKDIEANAILILFQNDGFEEIGERAKEDTSLYMQICHLVTTRQALELEPGLINVFGKSYLKKYSQLCKENTWFRPKDLAK